MTRRFSYGSMPWWNLFLGALFLILAGFVGYFLGARQAALPTVKAVRYAGDYTFVSPILYTEVPESLALPEYTPLKNALAGAVAQATAAHSASDIGVYFRDLNEGHWTGINQAHTFEPASLIKVATLMTALRLTEGQPDGLTKELHVVFGADYVDGPQDYYPPKDPVQPDGRYSIENLLSHLIIQSDNRAADVLGYYFGTSELDKTLTDLNVPIPETTSSEVDTPQQYSHLFRALYNGSYLTPAASEKALSLLSQSTFVDGLVAGVPAGTVVAHKFGERSFGTDSGANANDELHDCGIVYLPSHPYFLCVMTKGTDFPTLAKVIKNISMITWNQVTTRYK